jgi:hypothetical protein
MQKQAEATSSDGRGSGTTSQAAFGFLTAVDSPTHGVFGGYLIVDGLGRPLEFHCTAPVKVSRAQQILYGPTLTPHLHGQQIGGTLLGEGEVEPVVVLTDLPALVHVRQHTRLPVALVEKVEAAATADAGGGLVIGGTRVTVAAGVAWDDSAAAFREQLESLAGAVDLCEPFERIRLALDEAQRS